MDISWRDTTAGTAKRVAHYLATEVGEGNTFQKGTLRQVVENIEQVDRRMRDLRKVGWIIRTYKDKASLKPNELFLEKIGDPVWEDGYKWPAEGLTAAKRRAVFDRDGRKCLVCGIDFGEEYPDRPGVKAQPTIGHILPKARGGTNDLENLRPECQVCNETARNLTPTPVDIDLFETQIMELGRDEKTQLASWMLGGRRTFTRVDSIWSTYNQLPLPQKERIQRAVSESLT